MSDQNSTNGESRLFLEDRFQEAEEEVELRFEEGTLVLTGVGEEASMAPWWTYDDRVEAWRCPGGRYRQGLAELLRKGWAVIDEARDYGAFEEALTLDYRPYEHQREAVEAWREQGKRGVVVLPTGSGKTYVAMLAMELAARSTLVVVPTIDLMSQWVANLEEAFHIEVGMLGGGSHELREVTVSTYDSAAIHMHRIGGMFGMVIFDEVHHLPGEVYRQGARQCVAPFRLGLTATPERSDGGHGDFDRLVGPICYRKSIRDLSGDILADYEVRTIGVVMDQEDRQRYESERSIYRGFIEEEGIRLGGLRGWRRFLAATNRSDRGRRALEAYQNQKRLALVHDAKLECLYDLLARHGEERILVFTNDNASVYQISERLLAPAITHQTRIKERRQVLDRFRDGRYRVLITSKVLNEGVDIPEATMAVILAGSGSVREHVQRLGRILRRSEGKKALLYELVTEDSVESHVSQRRREHDAYK